MQFTTNASEAMRIDSSGNLLVGTTTATGISNGTNAGIGLVGQLDYIAVARSGGSTAYFNRLTSDGDIVEFRKDGSSVGSIGARGGDVYLETGNTGIRMYDASEAIIPVGNTGVSRDGAIDLGLGPNLRFKDLYLSGGVYLGGTGAANKLDDYEEGEWTPELGATGANPTGTASSTNGGHYIKVGNLVFIRCNFNYGSVSGGSGSLLLGGLPFAGASVYWQSFTLGYTDTSANYAPTSAMLNGDNFIHFWTQGSSDARVDANTNYNVAVYGTSFDFYVTGCYYSV
jgi:hypothetical protein